MRDSINNELRKKLEHDIDAFFSKGGEITHCPPCTLSDSFKRKENEMSSILKSKKQKQVLLSE